MSTPIHRGLTTAEAEQSRAKHGPNVLTPPPRDPWWKQYLEKFDDPVIRILMIAAAIAIGAGAVEGHVAVEGVGIIIAIFLATFLAFWNEYRANKEFDVLNQTNDDVPVKTFRNGGVTTVPRRDIVVGDVCVVETGEEAPADGKLLEAVSLSVAEAKLTGEPLPVEKVPTGTKPPKDSTIPADQLRRGSVVVDGYGVFEVTTVGDKTEFGKTLIDSIKDSGKNRTLNAQLEKLSKIIGVVGFGIAVITFAALIGRSVILGNLELTSGQWLVTAAIMLGVAAALVKVWLPIVYDFFDMVGIEAKSPSWLGGDDDDEEGGEEDGGSWLQGAMPWLVSLVVGVVLFGVGVGAAIGGGMVTSDPASWLPKAAGQEFLRNFMIAVTIIVVAVPEGLAMSVTLSLAYSMRKMTASNTLVRRMDACETIGAATVICSDKTGTLTLNEMRVHEAALGGPNGAAALPTDVRLKKLLTEAISANTTAHLSRQGNEPVKPVGNPTEGSLLLWLDTHGEDYVVARGGFEVRTQWTFTTERKMMGTLGRSPVFGRDVLHVKGAPELVLVRCAQLETGGGPKPLDDAMRSSIVTALAAYQARGMRTLGLAYRADPPAGSTVEEVADRMVWIGFVAIADPVRPDVPPAIGACRVAGVNVKIITGDSPETAREIANQIGLVEANDPPGAYMTGPAFMALDDEQAKAAAGGIKVLARARPGDKLRIVRLLKDRGEVVAVTGDGVNDGPALNHADVGLAMGKTGTAVAKEASDIILLDDSFNSIVSAVRWGRSLYENIQRFILFQLTINVAALGIAMLGPFIGYELPLTVMQMLWVNLIMDTFAALALATEPPHEGVLRRPPRSPADFIVSKNMAVEIFTVAGIFLVLLIGLIVYLNSTNELGAADKATRGGTILFSVFVLLQFWNLFNAKCMGRTGSVFPTLGNNPSFLLIALAIFLGQVAIVQFGGDVFRTVPLTLEEWGVILGATSVVLWVGEARRLFGK